jgi:hypothetical protein
MTARAVLVLLFVLGAAGCKRKDAPPSPPPSADAAITAPPVSSTPARAPTAPSAPHASGPPEDVDVDAIAVSSRVDNETETPYALVDQDLDTAWSSRTDELEGAWIALRIRSKSRIVGVELTVGMTKSAELFSENPRIAEVSLAFTPLLRDGGGAETLVTERAALDPESRELQRVPADVSGPGILKLSVTKVRRGTKSSWREVSVSEITLDTARGRAAIHPYLALVGGFDPLPRGTLGLVPERAVPLGCFAVKQDPGGPRVVCALGTWLSGGSTTHDAELVTLDARGRAVLGTLDAATSAEPMLSYGQWLRAEREMRGGQTLLRRADAGVVRSVPPDGEITVDGATFQNRTTKRDHVETTVGSWDELNGVVEVRWPGAESAATLLGESAIVATQPMLVTAEPIGSAWLVERRMTHGSEGISGQGADAAVCLLAARRCTPR